MSQQEFVPEFQKNQEQEKRTPGNTLFGRKPSFRPGKARTDGVPKNDHPSTFDESIPPHSYRARESVSSSQRQVHDKERSRKPARMTSRWRSYTYYTGRKQMPRWDVRSMKISKKSIWSWIITALLIFVLIKALPIIIGVVTALLGILALIILIPIIVVLALLIAVAVMAILAYIGITRHRRKMWR